MARAPSTAENYPSRTNCATSLHVPSRAQIVPPHCCHLFACTKTSLQVPRWAQILPPRSCYVSACTKSHTNCAIPVPPLCMYKVAHKLCHVPPGWAKHKSKNCSVCFQPLKSLRRKANFLAYFLRKQKKLGWLPRKTDFGGNWPSETWTRLQWTAEGKRGSCKRLVKKGKSESHPKFCNSFHTLSVIQNSHVYSYPCV